MNDSPPKRIIVTSGAWQAALNCVQSLGRLGHAVYLLDSDRNPPLGRSRYCRGHLLCPDEYASPDFAERLLQIVTSDRYDVLIPISDRTMDVASHHRDELGRHVALVLPDPELLELARDKSATTQFATSCGVRVPNSRFPTTMEEVVDVATAVTYPQVVKVPRGTAGQGVFVVNNVEETVRCFETYAKPNNWPFMQRFVAGDIADVAAVCVHGKLVTYFSFYAEVDHLIGGTPPYVRSLVDPELIEISRHLVHALGWHGPIDLDFIRTAAGQYYLLEINPRFSGSTNFAYKLGIDLPRTYLELASGLQPASTEPDFEDGWLFRTVFPAEVIWWRRNMRKRTSTVVRNLVRPRTKTNIYWDDPGLVSSQVREAWGILRSERH